MRLVISVGPGSNIAHLAVGNTEGEVPTSSIQYGPTYVSIIRSTNYNLACEQFQLHN